jgi:hypothetical protein
MRRCGPKTPSKAQDSVSIRPSGCERHDISLGRIPKYLDVSDASLTVYV